MTLKNTIHRLFGRNDTPSAPALRNKPGGMAWIKPYGKDYGAHVLAGQAVKTVRLVYGDCWEIEPRLPYVVGPCGVRGPHGREALPGDLVLAIAIADECLEPWREIGDDERDESLSYLPPVPASLVNIVKERL